MTERERATSPGPRPTPARVVYLERGRRLAKASNGGCARCGSLFVAHEPAFVHCRYCGVLIRIPSASLEEQELFEIRSGLRVAS